MLFAGLFVVVGAAERAGSIGASSACLAPLGLQTVAGLTATTAILSNAVSNVPAVMLFTRLIPRLPDPRARGSSGDGQHAGRQPDDWDRSPT